MRHGAGAYVLWAFGGARGPRAGRHVPEDGGAGLKFNSSDRLKLGLPAGKQPVRVTRLDPPLENTVRCTVVSWMRSSSMRPNQLEKTFSPSSARNRAFTCVHRSMSTRVARVGPRSPRSIIRQLREKETCVELCAKARSFGLRRGLVVNPAALTQAWRSQASAGAVRSEPSLSMWLTLW